MKLLRQCRAQVTFGRRSVNGADLIESGESGVGELGAEDAVSADGRSSEQAKMYPLS